MTCIHILALFTCMMCSFYTFIRALYFILIIIFFKYFEGRKGDAEKKKKKSSLELFAIESQSFDFGLKRG